ncbi:MAG: F0F1 ATP synthase subunit gamma [Porticoccaceae bacterium]
MGAKSVGFSGSYGGSVLAAVSDLGDAPSAEELLGVIKVMLDASDEGKIDRLYLVSNDFVNTMTQKPAGARSCYHCFKVTTKKLAHHWDYIYEPDDAAEILEGLLVRYVESQVYQAVVENKACEHGGANVGNEECHR